MASLLGKADSTLAGMSLREAMADVMPDYSDIYKQKAEGFEENQLAFQKAVGDYFDIQHADNNKLADELKEATTKAMQGLGTDYKSMELFNSHLTSMKDRMKALPKNKKGDFERSKIRAEMNQLLESSNGLDDTLTKVGTMIDANQFNKHTTDYPALLAISKGEATKEIVDGNLVYTYEDAKGKKQTIDRQGIEDALGQSDLEIDGIFIKQGPEAFKLGKQGGKFNRNKSVNGYEKMFTSPAGLAANMNEKQGGLEYTFVESLAGKDGSESIYKALTNMGPTTVAKYDANNDNRITAADFANPENGIALIESLTNPRSDNYNFQAAKTAAAEFYSDNIDQVEFNDGKSLRPAKTGTKTDGTKTDTNPYGFTGKEIRIGPTKGGGSNTYQDRMEIPAATTLIGKIEKGTGFPFGSNNYNYLFDEKTGEGAWHEFKPGEAISKPTETSFIGSAQDLESSIFRTNLPQFQNLETTVDNSKSLSSSGTVIEEGEGNLNPFDVGEIPQGFINAVGEGDEELAEYIKNNFKDIPNLSASGAGIGSDKIVVGMGEKGKNRKTKIFTTVPFFASDEDRAAEIWNWMKSNYSSKKKFD